MAFSDDIRGRFTNRGHGPDGHDGELAPRFAKRPSTGIWHLVGGLLLLVAGARGVLEDEGMLAAWAVIIGGVLTLIGAVCIGVTMALRLNDWERAA